MPAWLKQHRDAYRDRLASVARQSHRETGIWFLARGASRQTDEQETVAVWGDLLRFSDLEDLPGYSSENLAQAIRFWQSWQNRATGRLYNPLYEDPQDPGTKRQTSGNRHDYSPDSINTKYIPAILAGLGAKLPLPVNATTRADSGVDTFDALWKWIPQWATSPAGAFPIAAACELDAGNTDRIPQVEAGMGALLRAYHRETGMWRPEPLDGFPWPDYQPSSGFKIISRLCGYVGMENFPEPLARTAIDNLLAHRNDLYAHVSTARNYGETMAHYLMLTDYRHDDLLNAMQQCLDGFRDASAWKETGDGCYSVFGSGLIGAFMNWEDLPFDQALGEWMRFEHGCTMRWRFVADPYGNWMNAIPKEPEAVFGHPGYDVTKYGLKARNRLHWAKHITELIPQSQVPLQRDSCSRTAEGTWRFSLTRTQLAGINAPYLKATWSGAYDIALNGEPVKRVRYNLPHTVAGWHIPAAASATLHDGENTVHVTLRGPGKDPSPGAPLSAAAPFIRLGVLTWQ